MNNRNNKSLNVACDKASILLQQAIVSGGSPDLLQTLNTLLKADSGRVTIDSSFIPDMGYVYDSEYTNKVLVVYVKVFGWGAYRIAVGEHFVRASEV